MDGIDEKTKEFVSDYKISIAVHGGRKIARHVLCGNLRCAQLVEKWRVVCILKSI